MMIISKHTLLLIFILFLFQACNSKKELIQPKIECKVLSYKQLNYMNVAYENVIYTYNSNGQEIERKGVNETYKSEYDSQNNLISYSRYINTWKISERLLTYNSKNQLLKEVNNYSTTPNVMFKNSEMQYEYHPNGKIKKTLFFVSTLTTPDNVTNYNEQGNKTSVSLSNGNTQKLEYNSQNQLIKFTTYQADIKKTIEDVLEYNNKNLLAKLIRKENGILSLYATKEYNNKNQLISEIWYANNNNITQKYITVYTGESFVKTYYGSGNVAYSREEEEIIGGLLIKKSEYLQNFLKKYEKYEYDSYKNVIKKETGTPPSVFVIHEEWTYKCP